MLKYMTLFTFLAFLTSFQVVLATPAPVSDLLPAALIRRQSPVFPADPPSCLICEQNYSNISSCAQAVPVLANFTMVLFNPGAFIDVIKCACTDTFQAAYPQCVDCFTKTGQDSFLNPGSVNLSSVISGIRQVCGLESTFFGNVSGANNETVPTTSAPTPSTTSRATIIGPSVSFIFPILGAITFISLHL